MYLTIDPLQKDSIFADREHRAKAFVTIISEENDTLLESNLQIKTRGNSTFRFDKKSFSLKFPKRAKILGLDKSKSFVLLANSMDPTFIHNAVAFDLARAIDLPAPKYTYIRLYINNDYIGLYQMTNKVEVNKHSLNITNLEKANKQCNPAPISSYTRFCYGNAKMNNGVAYNREKGSIKGVLLDHTPDDISGGYIIDNSGFDWVYIKSPSGFVSAAGDPVRIRSPKYASPEETAYIATVYNRMESAILSADGINSETGKHYSEYMDMPSFVRYYLIQELIENVDAGKSSFYMYKYCDAVSTKIFVGPVWDCDNSFGATIFPSCNNPRALYAASQQGDMGEPHSGNLLYHLYQHKEFRDSVRQVYFSELRPAVLQYLNENKIDSLAAGIGFYAKNEVTDHARQINQMKQFLTDRLDYLDWVWSTPEEEMICVIVQFNYQNGCDNDRWVRFYMPPNQPATFQPVGEPYNASPRPNGWHYKNTDAKVLDNTISHDGDTIYQQMRNPTWREVQQRRIVKKWHKIFG